MSGAVSAESPDQRGKLSDQLFFLDLILVGLPPAGDSKECSGKKLGQDGGICSRIKTMDAVLPDMLLDLGRQFLGTKTCEKVKDAAGFYGAGEMVRIFIDKVKGRPDQADVVGVGILGFHMLLCTLHV